MKKGSILIIVSLCVLCCVGWSFGTAFAAKYDQMVYDAQKRLTELEYNPGPIDGAWGKKTEAALKQFQTDQGLAVTGKLDEETIQKLDIPDPEKHPGEIKGPEKGKEPEVTEKSEQTTTEKTEEKEAQVGITGLLWIVDSEGIVGTYPFWYAPYKLGRINHEKGDKIEFYHMDKEPPTYIVELTPGVFTYFSARNKEMEAILSILTGAFAQKKEKISVEEIDGLQCTKYRLFSDEGETIGWFAEKIKVFIRQEYGDGSYYEIRDIKLELPGFGFEPPDGSRRIFLDNKQ